jgi:hypothetical protein
MEVAALIGLLGLGYVVTSSSKKEGDEGFATSEASGSARRNGSISEGFATIGEQPPFLPNGGQPPYLYPQSRTPPGDATVPGSPRQPQVAYANTVRDELPPSIRKALFSSPVPATSMNVPGAEAPPNYNSGKTIISPLTGLPMPTDEFTHNNMVPFFRGSVKQNISDEANRSKLDSMIGTGYDQIEKREQAPLFDPHREPTGNVTGLESFTNFAQDRIISSSNRAFEKPTESVMVGPGIKQGYSSLPIGGYQQFEVLEEARRYRNVDELRVASKPKITYEGMVNAGKAIGTQRGQIGEVRKYHPDKFFMNENGERNFTSAVAEITKPQIRSTQVFKFQSRPETTTQMQGPAIASDSVAGYAEPNYLLYTTQRDVTGERVDYNSNFKAAGAPQALTVYDPNDVARTTIRETTGAYDDVGIALGVDAQKLTVYDPTDIMRPTLRNTNAEVDTALNVTRAGVPGERTLQFPDGWKPTSKAELAGASARTNAAGLARATGEQVYDTAYAMRQNPIKELTAQGRRPVAGNGNLPVFNGEDNVNLSYRKITNDVINDRDNTANRVVSQAPGAADIGIMRPRQILQINVARDRNTHDVLDMLDDNPYALPVYRIAQQAPTARGLSGFTPGPAEMALRGH